MEPKAAGLHMAWPHYLVPQYSLSALWLGEQASIAKRVYATLFGYTHNPDMTTSGHNPSELFAMPLIMRILCRGKTLKLIIAHPSLV